MDNNFNVNLMLTKSDFKVKYLYICYVKVNKVSNF